MSVARSAFGIMATEAVKHADMARASGDKQSSAMFEEIGKMMLGICDDRSTPLLEVINGRQQRHRIGGSFDFARGRVAQVAMVLVEMERTGCTRHAACQKVAGDIHRRNGEKRSHSAGRELAKHVPVTLADAESSEVGREAMQMVRTIRHALSRKMEDGTDAPIGLVYVIIAHVIDGWRTSERERDKRASRLRSLFGAPSSPSRHEVDIDALGEMLLDVIVAEFQTPF